MKFLVVATLFCVMLVVESTEIGRGVAQKPCLYPENILNNMLRLERTVTKLRSRMEEMEENQQTLANRTAEERRRRVAFEVVLVNHMTFGIKEPFKFDHVALNTGNAYNPKIGIFVVPVSGTYLLWANIMSFKNHFHIGLFKDGGEISGAYTGSSMYYGTATINHVVQLKKGNHVWFAIRHYYTKLYGSKRSSFGGILMYT